VGPLVRPAYLDFLILGVNTNQPAWRYIPF
jgi:hypothetical protein